MTRRFERRNVVGFMLIGVLLTTVLVGGIWLARHPIGSSSQVASDSSATDDRNADSSADDTQATTDDELKESLSQQAAQSSDTQSSTTGSSSNSSTASNLPATGPGDVLFEMIGATALVGTTVAYVRSRSTA